MWPPLTDAEIVALGEGAPTRPCGHPDIAENRQSVGIAGVRCRICRRAISIRSARTRAGRAKERTAHA